MTSYRIDIDGGGYASAGQPLYDAGWGVGEALTTLMGRLGGLGQMAGKDDGGQALAAAYDPAAADLVRAGCALSGALQRMGLMVDTAAYNHQLANASSNLRTGNLPTKPSHTAVAPSPSTPPSASGGTGDLPGWWDKIKDHISVLWPDADTGRLRDAAAAWNEAASTVDGWQGMCSVSAGRLESTRSPEIASATAALSRLGAAMHTLAGQYRAVAAQGTAYADAVDRAHERANETITKFAWILGGTVVVAGVATIFTGPIGAGGGAAATGAEAGAAGAAVAADLAVAATEATAAAAAVAETGTAAIEVASTARVFATATIEVAETASAAEAAGSSATSLQGAIARASRWIDSYTISDASYKVTHGESFTGDDGFNVAMSLGGLGLLAKVGKGLKAAERVVEGEKAVEAERAAEEVAAPLRKVSEADKSAGARPLVKRDLAEEEKYTYRRPSRYRAKVRDRTWQLAEERSADGLVRDPTTNQLLSKDGEWHMGHKPGQEFRMHQQSAADRGITRKQFLDEHNDPNRYHPELPDSNWSHRGEAPPEEYNGP